MEEGNQNQPDIRSDKPSEKSLPKIDHAKTMGYVKAAALPKVDPAKTIDYMVEGGKRKQSKG
ncbi:MAG: hypothetical protein HC890_05785 [Chloroflexaceae bacterium]|nr:hypothetical protein [Chloroflexaceae bacterium]